MRELFPAVEEIEPTAKRLPVFRDIAWDFEADRPKYGPGGDPIIAEGLEALKGWAVNAIRTARYRWEIYSAQYGHELDRLVGQQYTEDTKLSEAMRYVREALLINPYINNVLMVNATFSEGMLTVDLTIETVYGEARISV